MDKIDIVVRWVDNGDLNWIEEKQKYKALETNNKNPSVVSSSGDIRYRDWELLRYWFRGIEKFAPWINKVFFITCGHKPQWLNVNHPKLRFISHDKFIPNEWLPTFSSRTIDFNIFRIKELSETFIFCDDDMFFLRETKPEDFFVHGIPCDSMVFNAMTATYDDVISSNIFNNMAVINHHFSKKDFSKSDCLKLWFTPKYGKYLYKNLVLSAWTYYLGFQDFHIPVSFLKSTYVKLWEKENTLLSQTCSQKFRKETDLNQWLLRYWQLASKNFVPRSIKIGRYYELSDDNRNIIRTIQNQHSKLLCINEGNVSNFEKEKNALHEAFNSILPQKCEYEL